MSEPGSDTKECPFCAEKIRAKAKKCRYCGEFLPGESREDVLRMLADEIGVGDIEGSGGVAVGRQAQGLQSGNVGGSVIQAQGDVTLGKDLREEQYRIALNWDGKANLREFDLSKRDLAEVLLVKADLRGANLSRANLSGANLSGANLSEANLSGANLSGRSPDWIDSLLGLDPSGAVPSRAYLGGANLSGANLSGANLSGANLSGANLDGTNLTGANLIGADLKGADLSGPSQVWTMVLGGSKEPNEADLRKWGVPSGAGLNEADLSKADLRGAKLHGADLSGAKLSRALYDDETRWPQWPERFDPEAAGAIKESW